MSATQTIELDCPPGSPRPDALIELVIKDTGLEPKLPCSTFFGNWTWDYSEVPADEWAHIQSIVRPRITDLYNAGAIRYGSW